MTMHLVNLPSAATAIEPMGGLSDNYLFLDSARVDQILEKEGFYRFSATQRNTRKPEKQGKQAHLVTYRHKDAPDVAKLGGLIPQVSFLNSHDGTTSYKLLGEIMRLVCLNGLKVSDRHCQTVKIAHRGRQDQIEHRIIDGAFSVISETVRSIETADFWSGIELKTDAMLDFASKALELKYPQGGPTQAPIRPEMLLLPRRFDDKENNLWTVFNRVQEHLIKGGQIGRNESGNRRTTRSIRNPLKDITINKALWDLADQYAIAA